MDILLAHAYFLDEDPLERKVMKPYPPLGLLYLSSHLKARGFRVSVFDSTFRSFREFRELVEAEKPPLVGIYCNLLTRSRTVDMLGVCRRAGCSAVVGGPEPANYPAQYLESGADAVVEGEGEETLEELIPALASGQARDLEAVQGIYYRDTAGNVRKTEPRPFLADLDAQPFPDREAIDLARYVDLWRRRHGRGAVSLITSRGCPYTCSWCSHGVFGFSHRSRSPANVADEVEWIRRRYSPDMLWYADDVFALNRRWFFAYAEELKRRDLVLPFETISREDRLDEEIIAELARLQCFRLWIGAESGSQRILDAMQRRTDAARVRRLVTLLKRYGIQAGLFVMLGYEGEELSDLEATAEHLKEAQPDVFLSTVAYPIKGTPYYDRVKERIVEPAGSWSRFAERDLEVAGRRPRRFYLHAMRWIRGEVELERLRRNGGGRLGKLKAWANSRLGRWGMRLQV